MRIISAACRAERADVLQGEIEREPWRKNGAEDEGGVGWVTPLIVSHVVTVIRNMMQGYCRI